MKISAAESRIMDVLWQAGKPLAAEDVTAILAGEEGWAEGTVRTFLQRLHKKDAVAAHKEGRRMFFQPIIQREAYLHAESKNVVDRLFDGRLGAFVAHFSDRENLSETEIAELKDLIEKLENGR